MRNYKLTAEITNNFATILNSSYNFRIFSVYIFID